MKFSIQSVYEWYRGLIRNPKYRWWVLIGTLVYFVSPIDVIPDIFPIVGELDDVFLLTLLVSEFSQFLIEAFKARKGFKYTQTEENFSEKGTKSTDTIDIDAASVE